VRDALKDETAIALFDKLKSVRSRFAAEENAPAFVIFANTTLIEMANARPKNLNDMAKISGVGEYKLKKYAAEFLKAINSQNLA
jgi:ATP-dependent DNA helicase RecQ